MAGFERQNRIKGTKMSKLSRWAISGCKVLVLLALAGGSMAFAQKRVDRSVATITDGVKTEIITYSDLLWQLALSKGAQLDPPSRDDLNRALQILINQRIFSLEAERIPRLAPTRDQINAEIKRIIDQFTPAEFAQRLNRVGFTSIDDPGFVEIISDRLAIEQYLEFRFRSFIVITPADEEKYYREVYVTEFRRRYPGVVVPTLEEKRADIRKTLTEDKVSSQIETFLDEAKRRVEIVIISDV